MKPETTVLKTGEALRIECIVAPDNARARLIELFLQHKPGPYRAHIRAALANECGDLETRFYIGLLNAELVGNIMTTEYRGIGILGHVHTRQDQRRKGICSAIMSRQMADFDFRHGSTLLLGTGYKSAAYRIYESFGFRDWPIGERGAMRFDSPAAEHRLESAAKSAGLRVSPAQWRHWPAVALLAASPGRGIVRSVSMGVWSVRLLEGAYCRFMAEEEGGERGAVLEASGGEVAAFATCMPDPRWPEVWLVDLIAHPFVEARDLTRLLERTMPHGTRRQAYADPEDTTRIAALKMSGFKEEATLRRQLCVDGLWRDVQLYGC
ncbi:MAG TPA: hypothetical protein VGS41_09645 [Chthonomonadales bacterium]|nr:hypothetical protein [Chthonomonadales bacterium]